MDTNVIEAPGRRRRRRHTAAFKAELIRACQQPGVSSAAVALANGINANLVRRWVNAAERDQTTAAAMPPASSEFVALQIPAAPTATAQPDIRIEFRRAGLGVTVNWPVSAAAQCAAWLRELLR